MDDRTVEILAIIALLVTLFVIAVLSRRRREPFRLRPIQAYKLIPGMIGRAIEADQPLHISMGSAGIGGESTALAVASAEMAYQIARRAAIGDTSPLLTLSNAAALPLGQDALRRAYQSRDFGDRYSATATRWYPSGTRSLAFAAALTAMIKDERAAGNVLVGSHGAEVALVMTTASRNHLPVVAASDQLEGQAVAYALGDAPLIGEEMFVSGAYLSDDPNDGKIAAIQDALRWLLVAAMLVGLIVTIGG